MKSYSALCGKRGAGHYEDTWYIIPEGKIEGKGSLAFYPKSKAGLYEEYKNAWCLLKKVTGSSSTMDIQACAEELPPTFF